ncbi:hypothetical protein H4R99_008042, partial [Coemansia sp. RSA 1722]
LRHHAPANRNADTNSARPLEDSSRSDLFTKRKDRHVWIPSQDSQLAELVVKHGRRWTLIAREMGLGIESQKYRSRWNRLKPTTRGAWTREDNESLRKAMEKVHKMSCFDKKRKGFWNAVALEIKHTGRSAHDCSTHWTALVQGRAGGKRQAWSQEEIHRLSAALDMVACVSDPPDRAAQIERSEPWLVPPMASSTNLVRGFWLDIARIVGTRSPHQCRIRCQQLNRRQRQQQQQHQRDGEIMTVEEVKQLATLAVKYNNRWEYIRHRFFPRVPARQLMLTYRDWQSTSKKYRVDLNGIDPLAMLPGYTGGLQALRPTGIDGKYDPNGSLELVWMKNQVNSMTPFKLALRIVDDMSRRRKDKKYGPFISKDASNSALLQWTSPHAIDKVVAAIGKHGSDMDAVAREAGLPLELCRTIAKGVVSVLPSMVQRASADRSKTAVVQKTDNNVE